MATCQIGAENAFKREMTQLCPDARFAYSRPGFLTFKLPSEHGLCDDYSAGSTFARALAFSLGKAAGEDNDERAAKFWDLLVDVNVERVHVWSPDLAPVGDRGYVPGPTTAASEVRDKIIAARPDRENVAAVDALRVPTRRGQLVADCVLVSDHEWWVGFHRATGETSCWPGGLREIEIPLHAVSRAYAKMVEALRWLRMSLQRGEQVAEIGCAPGGAAQALLDRGLHVLGIDPAEVATEVLAHPNFVHLQKRGAEVRRSKFHDVRLLAVDVNIEPPVVLDMVESIVNHRQADIRGLLITLKLPRWELADELPEYRARVKAWGYSDVRTRQLQHNRQEVCLAAVKRRRRRARP